MYLLGFDIGGTKCAVVTALTDGNNIELLKKEKCDTLFDISPEAMIDKLIALADTIVDRKIDAIGISCGGPLDSEKGVIMSPPNLPGWDNVKIVERNDIEYYGLFFIRKGLIEKTRNYTLESKNDDMKSEMFNHL